MGKPGKPRTQTPKYPKLSCAPPVGYLGIWVLGCFPPAVSTLGFRGPKVWGRNMRRPGLAGFGLILGGLAGDGRNVDEMLAAGTFDLAAGELFFAREMLLAMRALEFEFTHDGGRFSGRWSVQQAGLFRRSESDLQERTEKTANRGLGFRSAWRKIFPASALEVLRTPLPLFPPVN